MRRASWRSRVGEGAGVVAALAIGESDARGYVDVVVVRLELGLHGIGVELE